uniref:Uncharacterized protein n=1 Tax=Myoviridae sp. ctR2338 TaxID=2827608 RepID=A0A8S5LNK8_9CAUD|nr:MAG TPA: hypothetical protein [Myoviridae sp. ctR2338]
MPASPPPINELPFWPKIVGLFRIPPFAYQSTENLGTLSGESDHSPLALK